MEGLLSLAVQDTDDWVQTVALLLRDFCTTGGLNLSAEEDADGHFHHTLAEMAKLCTLLATFTCDQYAHHVVIDSFIYLSK